MQINVKKVDTQYCVTIKDVDESITKLQISDMEHMDSILGQAEYEVQKWQGVKEAIIELEGEDED